MTALQAKLTDDGKPEIFTHPDGGPACAVREHPKYTPHHLRHFFESLQIANSVRPKKLQQLMGHSSIQITMDRYGHLWKDLAGDRAIAAAVEKMMGEPQNKA